MVLCEEARRRSMHTIAIPNQDHPATIMMVQLPQKPNEVLGLHVFPQELEEMRQAVLERRYADDADRGDAFVAIPGFLHWRVPRRRPGATPYGLEHEAAFIQENQGR